MNSLYCNSVYKIFKKTAFGNTVSGFLGEDLVVIWIVEFIVLKISSNHESLANIFLITDAYLDEDQN